MWAMSGRPCNPGSDLRQLWQMLLGNTPFPQCGVSEKQENGDTPDARRPAGSEGSAAVRSKR
jgi:hypothetical protein